jgi:F-type H+-transporting ATPase subunit b
MHRRPLALLALASVGAMVSFPAIASASEGGLQIIPDPKRLLVLIVLFVALVPILNKLLFQPLLGVLDEREQRIDGARARATELARQAAALVARHDDAIRKARETAHAEQVRVVEAARGQHHTTVGDARKAAEAELAAARAEIARAVDSVRGSLRAEAEPIARDIASRLLGRSAA